MLSFTQDKGQCTGCTACKAVCPKQCITMQKDEEGFLYPVANDRCIDCKLCEKVCPIQHTIRPEVSQKAYAAVSRDKKIWQRSASGGAFSEICIAWGDRETMIVGAAWDGLHLHHVAVIGPENIAPLCKSKYVASDLEDVFLGIKNHLATGNKAIFCGTPCQVAGLRAFLKKPQDNLLLIDLICHGVGSPDVFEESMKVIGEQFGKEIVEYEFRSKKTLHDQDHITSTLSADCRERDYLVGDQYMQLFLSQKALRPSCGANCKFRDDRRQGDITLADFKGLQRVFPNLAGSKYNYSSIVTNNAKGDSVVQALYSRMEIQECQVKDIKEHNPLFHRQTWFSEERGNFFVDFLFDKHSAILKHTKPAKKYKMKTSKQVYFLLPHFLRNLIYKVVR